MKNNFVTEWDKVSDNDNSPIIENPEEVSPDNFYNHFIENVSRLYEEFYY